ncbi:MAG: MoaA/NifB/PqqE/SkfB family radical SAM enzyme [Myxococcota bacterium]|jgi:MoaA/NifB/PqqE/SkfB family radical SAM enzyme
MSDMNKTPWIGPHGQVMRRLELHLTYTCPERCIFCSEEARMKRYRSFPVTWGRVARVLREHAERGGDAVHFTGGEPTIHPRFIDACQLAHKLGMRTSIGSIGTMMSREDFARRALPHLDEALFSLHGPSAAVHDPLTRRPGSFDRVTGAIRTARALKPDFGLFVNTVLTKHNVEALPETVVLAAELGAQLIVVSNLTPEGGGEEHYAELAPSLEQLSVVLPAAAEALAGRAVLRFFGVPMCILGEHRMLSNDLHWDPRVTVEWTSKPGKVVFDGLYSWAPDRKRVHTPECDDCALRGVCTGVFDQYAERHPTTALRAVRQAG